LFISIKLLLFLICDFLGVWQIYTRQINTRLILSQTCESKIKNVHLPHYHTISVTHCHVPLQPLPWITWQWVTECTVQPLPWITWQWVTECTVQRRSVLIRSTRQLSLSLSNSRLQIMNNIIIQGPCIVFSSRCAPQNYNTRASNNIIFFKFGSGQVCFDPDSLLHQIQLKVIIKNS